MSKWKDNFQEHTGRMAFVLTMSKMQITALEWLRDGHKLLGLQFNHFIRIEDGLMRRGLIEQHYDPDPCEKFPDRKIRRIEVTPAGHLVCELLVRAGLMSKKRIRSEAA